MLRLILLRHAKAAPLAGGGDSERPLTQRGRRDAQRVGETLAGAGLFPDLAIVSPAKRTRETLDFALEVFGEACPVRAEPRLYLAEESALFDLLRDTPPFVRLLLAVGHNPGFHDLALALTGHGDARARAQMEQGFPTSSLALIDFDAPSWSDLQRGTGVLARFVTPEDRD